MSDEAVVETAPVPLPAATAGAGSLAYDELVASGSAGGADGADLSLVFDLPVELAVEIGRTTMTIRETLAIAPGSLIQLNRLAGEPVDLLVNGHRIARGEVVAIDEEFGLRVTEIVSPE
ncbi:MAG TPA: flagellar motor switch protein FliN [Gaiellaceae bacterium]|jgi:flagellar motor switch protein FliN/FliY|nr:flagellar motor switch protein FliN [Gaiellaceae bacterium]